MPGPSKWDVAKFTVLASVISTLGQIMEMVGLLSTLTSSPRSNNPVEQTIKTLNQQVSELSTKVEQLDLPENERAGIKDQIEEIQLSATKIQSTQVPKQEKVGLIGTLLGLLANVSCYFLSKALPIAKELQEKCRSQTPAQPSEVEMQPLPDVLPRGPSRGPS